MDNADGVLSCERGGSKSIFNPEIIFCNVSPFIVTCSRLPSETARFNKGRVGEESCDGWDGIVLSEMSPDIALGDSS